MADEKYVLGGSQIAYKIHFNDLLLETLRRATLCYSRHRLDSRYAVEYCDTVQALADLIIGYINKQWSEDVSEELKKISDKFDPLKKGVKNSKVYANKEAIAAHRKMFQNIMKLMKKKGFTQSEGVTSVMTTSASR